MRGHFIFLVIFFIPLISSDIANALNLEEVVEEAMENNPEILAAQERWKAASAMIPQVRWWSNPQIGIGFGELLGENYSPGDARMRMYSISQMIPFPGKLMLKGRTVGKDAQRAEESYKEKKNEVVAKVKSAYFDLFFVHKSIQINRENKDLIQKFARIAETRYMVGKASQHDVLKAQVELSLIIDDLIILEEETLPTAEAKLNVLLNRPPHSPLSVPEEVEIPELKKSREELKKLTREHRPELKRMKYVVEKSNASLTLAKMQYLPDLMIKLEQDQMKMTMSTEMTRGVMFSVNIPLWIWKQGAGVREKTALRRLAEFSYQAMKNRVLFEVQEALSKFRASERRVKLIKTTIIPQAEQALKAATIAYETGKVDFLTLMNSERMLRDARLKYYKALAQHGRNLAELERVVGTNLTLQNEGG